jgi:cardiolipin synthase (CMP-forming)
MLLKRLPNLITCLRLVLVLPLVYCLLDRHYTKALGYFFAAGFSDAVDGYLARNFNWTSRFGAFLDPLADKCLMLASFTALMWLGNLPFWLYLLVVFRDLIIIVGVALVLLVCGNINYQPTYLSKVNTTLQIGFVLSTLINLAFFNFPPEVVYFVMWPMVVTTIASVLQYVMLGAQQVLNVK